jgi:hypothetical protein
MDSAQEQSGNDKELATEVVESLGEPSETAEETSDTHGSMGHENMGDPLYVQKRLKQQKRSYDRTIREMSARVAELESQISPHNPQSFDANPNVQPGGYSQGGVDETISKAVSYALQQRDQEERKAKAAQDAAHIARQYDNLQNHLDSLADKYDDFDDVVRGNHAPFTPVMRDAATMLPKKGPGSAGEVLYKLGKNPDELARISKLHPQEQAAELIALSHALISGGEQKGSASRPLGQIKSNPVVNSAGVTEKTSPSQIRALMKAGKFK